MNNLKHITFTGVDANTDIHTLQEIQKRWPIVEFGVLTSYHWYENGNRYLDPRLMRNLEGLNLALHLCGSAAHDAACGNWHEIEHLTYGSFCKFNRVQLNIAERKDNPTEVAIPSYLKQEIIIQQRDKDHLDIYLETLKNNPLFDHNYSTLLDASGGRGINTGIDILHTSKKIGYAGGFNPDNVEEKLSYLLENVDGPFWIDMESGVRTDDWFDLNKVIKVMEICDPLIKKH